MLNQSPCKAHLGLRRELPQEYKPSTTIWGFVYFVLFYLVYWCSMNKWEHPLDTVTKGLCWHMHLMPSSCALESHNSFNFFFQTGVECGCFPYDKDLQGHRRSFLLLYRRFLLITLWHATKTYIYNKKKNPHLDQFLPVLS